MGGFVLDTSPTPILGSETRFVLTPRGVRFVMKNAPELIPDLSEDSLLDRSKADGFQKSLFIWQLGYFCCSCAERLVVGLPVSLLEVSTVAHALCMLSVCLLWWRKLWNVLEPTIISGPRARDIAALLLLTTPRFIYRTTDRVQHPVGFTELRLLTVTHRDGVSATGGHQSSSASEAQEHVDRSLSAPGTPKIRLVSSHVGSYPPDGRDAGLHPALNPRDIECNFKDDYVRVLICRSPHGLTIHFP